MNTYFCREDYMVGICSDGTEFIFDKEDFEKIKEWNWMHHNNDIDGAKGKMRKSLAKVVLGLEEYKLPILKRVKNFDFRKSNLYYENNVVDNGEYLEIETISGDIIFADKEDYDLVRKYRWYINNAGYPEAKLGKKIFRLHRMILGLNGEFSYTEVVDHINRNTLDNRRKNLRIVPQAENTRNRAMSSSNTTGVPCVNWSKELNAWRAAKMIDGKKYNLGAYNKIEEAANAVKEFDECMARGEEYIPKPTYVKRKSSTGEKYIYKSKSSGFIVKIKEAKSDKYLGVFPSIEEAILARDRFLGK